MFQLLPENVSIEILSIADIPLYNADIDLPQAAQRPKIVQEFRDKLAKENNRVNAQNFPG